VSIKLRRSLRVSFPGSQGRLLAGIIDLPQPDPRAGIVLAHCFTCTKDIKALVRISRGLAALGWACLRFDFAGLGQSQGDFSQTNFSTQRQDLIAAVEFLHQQRLPVRLLFGHSFGGAAALSVAEQVPEVLGVCGLAAPSDTQHLAELLSRRDPDIDRIGVGQVEIGGRTHRISRGMLEDFRSFDLPGYLRRLTKPVMLFHSPRDETVGIEHAWRMLGWLQQRGPGLPPPPYASLVCLHGADHLLMESSADIELVAGMTDLWLQRRLHEAGQAVAAATGWRIDGQLSDGGGG
jgi:uncharacterized protein